MRIAIWKTGHEIADTVAQAIKEGMPDAELRNVYQNAAEPHWHVWQGELKDQINIAYGILRGTDHIFQNSDVYFNVDRGYFNANHYSGHYRISLRGTQQTTGLDKLTPDYDRWRALGVELKPWRGFDENKPVLVIPPTEHVKQFFNLGMYGGLADKIDQIHDLNWKVREKGDPSPINFSDYNYVLTFNSSVGWQALQAGIPCISDPKHSIVGAWFKDHKLSESLSEAQYKDRERLFGVMSSLQLTLDEMRAGKLWPLLSRLMSISVGTPEKNAQAM